MSVPGDSPVNPQSAGQSLQRESTITYDSPQSARQSGKYAIYDGKQKLQCLSCFFFELM